MLKNNDLRREFILNDSNWKQIDVIESLKIRVLELKLNSHISLLKFEKLLTQQEKGANQYLYSRHEIGDYIPFDWGCGRYYRMVDGLLITGSCMHINKAVEVVKNTEEDK